MKVVAVNWTANVNSTVKSQIGAFYTAITNSAYMDWLSEYDTVGIKGQDGQAGSGQRIGRGTFAGSYTITPTVNTTTNVKNSEIAQELAAQIAAGKLPAPETDAAGNVNTIYMIDFPSTITITIDNFGSPATSCVQFCAYHFTTTINGKSVPYGVHPDVATGGCAGGCGSSSNAFNNATSVHSHELIEAITDTEIGLSDPNAPNAVRPMAWYNNAGGEIGDLCNAQQATIGSYTVQKEWSNSAGACIATATTIICDGSSPAIPGCRACTAADNGKACNGVRPYCETDSTNVKFGQCVPCTTSSQCTSPAVCIKSTGADDDTCGAAQTGCTSNSQCSGSKPICDTGTKQCRACQPADCSGATPACETAGANAGKCVQCTSGNATACTGTTPACDTTQDKCVACVKNSDCPATSPVCDTTAHTCRGCTSNTECTAPAVCATGSTDPHKGQCVQCTSNAQCTAPATCDTTKDTCVQCTSDAQCANPKPVCGQNESCRGCANDNECANNANGHACAASGACQTCTSSNTSACPASKPACDDSTGTCVQCTGNNDCTDPTKPDCDTSSNTCTCLSGNCGQTGNDAGTGDDAGSTSHDAGVDSGVHKDAGVDSGAHHDASTGSDAGDDGGGGTGDSGGCAVSASGTGNAGTGAALGGILLGLAAIARRKRASR